MNTFSELILKDSKSHLLLIFGDYNTRKHCQIHVRKVSFMKERTKNILIGSGLLVTGVAVAKVAHDRLTKYLMRLALDREPPKGVMDSDRAQALISGSEDLQDFMNALEEAGAKLADSDCEEVSIICSDGERLVGHWHACDNPKRTIIAMHGWRSSWYSDFGLIADFWYENDCNVLFVEQRGQNNSGGEYMGFGLLERFDCLDWIHWVNERCGTTLPIYLGGVSMGATTVLMATGLDLPENVKGVVADCGFTSPYAIWKHVAENNLHLPYILHAQAAEELCKKNIMAGPTDYSTIDAMKECKIPVLFVHGTDDDFVPIEMTYENYKACNSEKELLVVPGANHGMSYYVDKERYEQAIKNFWGK